MAIKQRITKLEQRRGQGEKIDYAAILERARERVENGEVPKPLTREELTEQISQLEIELFTTRRQHRPSVQISVDEALLMDNF